tara:strand:- start:4465 stop:4905 length:441 start_codon:yes stop_codon:yes gene_type:complete
MKESKENDPPLPTSLSLTVEMGEFVKDLFKLLTFVFIYILRYLFFKKSSEEVRSFLHLFGEDLCFSFGKSLVIVLGITSFFVSGIGAGNFFFSSFGSFVLINLYLIFFRFNVYLRWLAFVVFFIFFFLEAFNLNFNRDREARLEPE